MPAFVVGGADAIDSIEGELQNLMMRLRYAQVPVVPAPSTAWLWAVAGELAVSAPAAWPTWKAHIGLVEVVVGLIPGAGGLTYIAGRAAEKMHQSTSKACCPS